MTSHFNLISKNPAFLITDEIYDIYNFIKKEIKNNNVNNNELQWKNLSLNLTPDNIVSFSLNKIIFLNIKFVEKNFFIELNKNKQFYEFYIYSLIVKKITLDKYNELHNIKNNYDLVLKVNEIINKIPKIKIDTKTTTICSIKTLKNIFDFGIKNKLILIGDLGIQLFENKFKKNIYLDINKFNVDNISYLFYASNLNEKEKLIISINKFFKNNIIEIGYISDFIDNLIIIKHDNINILIYIYYEPNIIDYSEEIILHNKSKIKILVANIDYIIYHELKYFFINIYGNQYKNNIENKDNMHNKELTNLNRIESLNLLNFISCDLFYKDISLNNILRANKIKIDYLKENILQKFIYG